MTKAEYQIYEKAMGELMHDYAVKYGIKSAMPKHMHIPSFAAGIAVGLMLKPEAVIAMYEGGEKYRDE